MEYERDDRFGRLISQSLKNKTWSRRPSKQVWQQIETQLAIREFARTEPAATLSKEVIADINAG